MKYLALIATGLAALALTFCAFPNLVIDRSLSQLFPERSTASQELEKFETAFGTDDLLLMVVTDRSNPPLFNQNCLEYLDEVTQVLLNQKAVVDVVSIANLETVSLKEGFGRLFPIPGPFLSRDRESLSEEAAQDLRNDPFLKEGLISEDGQSAACWILLDPQLRDSPDYLSQIEQCVEKIPTPGPHRTQINTSITGFPLIHAATEETLRRDSVWFTGLSLILIALLARYGGVSTAQILGFLVSWMIITGIASTWMWLSERPIHLFSNAILPLLMVVSGNLLIHLGRADSGRHRPVLIACILATVTTAIGFGVLTFSRLEPLARLGTEVAIGAFLTLIVLTGVMRFLPAANKTTFKDDDDDSKPLPTSRLSARPLVLLMSLLCLPWFLLSHTEISAQGDFISYLPGDDPRVEDYRQAEAAMGALTSFEVILQVPRSLHESTLLQESFYLTLSQFQDDLIANSMGEISFVLSPVTLIRFLNRQIAIAEGAEQTQDSFIVTKRSARLTIDWFIAPYLKLTDASPSNITLGPLNALKEKMSQLLSRDGTQIRFGCRIPTLDPNRIMVLKRTLEEELFPKYANTLDGDFSITGYSVLVSEASKEIEDSQNRSLIYGAIALGLLLLAIARSLRTFFIASLTNLFAACGLANALWVLGIQLDLYTVILTASMLAVFVDDTIHILVARRQSSAELARVSRSVLVTSLALALGFTIFGISDMPAFQRLAGIAVTGIALALYWDLIILPRWLDRWQGSPQALSSAAKKLL